MRTSNYNMFENKDKESNTIKYQNVLSTKHQPRIIGSLNVTSQSFQVKNSSLGLPDKAHSLNNHNFKSRQSN